MQRQGEKSECWLQNFKILQLFLHCVSTATFHILILFFIDSMSSKKHGKRKTINAYKKGSNSATEPSIDISYSKCLAFPIPSNFFFFFPDCTSETTLMMERTGYGHLTALYH